MEYRKIEMEKLLSAYPGFDKDGELRIKQVRDGFANSYGKHDPRIFSAPGRTEISGNHTDHQHGCVLAAAVNMDILAAALPNGTKTIRVISEGFEPDSIDLSDMAVHDDEKNTSAALIRGVAAKIIEMGYPVGGFDVYAISNVLKGSGLSSSAAFEVLIGTVINGLFCKGELSPVEIAKIGQFAENVYFGKLSGLMDQTASAVGGIVSIDFKDPKFPDVRKLDFDFENTGYSLCIIDSGADHADLSDEYSAIPTEMRSVAALLGTEVLRDADEKDFVEKMPEIRKKVGDRAVIRAFHFFRDSKRPALERECLEKGDFNRFLELVRESGQSSAMYLQNVRVEGSIKHQDVLYTLAACDMLLDKKGAFRVHGGGFAGTVQAFVPNDILEEFKMGIEKAVGKGSCHVLSIRTAGGIELT